MNTSSLIPFILALIMFLLFGVGAYGLYRGGQYAKPGGMLMLGFLILAVLFMLFVMIWLLLGGRIEEDGGVGGHLPSPGLLPGFWLLFSPKI